jgi:lipoprotein Spr
MKKYYSAYSFLFLFFPPIFFQAPSSISEGSSFLVDSAFISAASAFAEMGVPINYNSNARLYTELNKWLGTPHIRRSRGKGGIDCSGLVKIIYQNVYGMELAGSSNDMSRQAKPIKPEELKEGDLIFFRIYNPSRIDHVGIYLGNDRFIHTSSSRGVIVDKLSSPYFKRRLAKTGRILPYQSELTALPEDQ